MNSNSVPQIALKALRNIFFVGVPGLIICAFVDLYLALGFMAGLLICIANLFMLYSAVLKVIMLSPDKARRNMMIYYPLRFSITVILMGYMVWSAAVSPLTLLLGFIVTLMTAVITTIYMLWGDIDPFPVPLRDL